MPKCLECGFEAPRLQWTHFRYKCIGKFKNGEEYKLAYPGAKLVDDELAKSTAVTLKNLVNKYGEEEGKKRWDEYRKKQAETNSFEYKHKKYGWTKEQFDEYNKSRAVTLKNLIKKYGDEVGTKKWIEYCERQAYTNTLTYFIEKYGEIEGEQRFNKLNYEKQHNKTSIGNSSKIELNFVNALESLIGEELDYSCKTKQFCIYANDKVNFYDIVHNNRAIEFNGDYWHCNPSKYEANFFHPHYEMLAEDIWKRDLRKIKALADNRNIDTLVIWESEFRSNPKQTLERCKKWLTSKDN